MSDEGGVFSGLGLETQDEILKLMKFFQVKREESLRSISGDIDDVRQDLKSISQPYSSHDVSQALNHLEICLKDGISRDLMRMLSMNILIMKQLLQDAHQQGLDLHINTSTIENSTLLQQLQAIPLDDHLFEAKAQSKNNTFSTKCLRLSALKSLDDRNHNDQSHLRLQLAQSKAQLEDSRLQLDAKINHSKQFIQLKHILADKNKQIASLRHRLQQYEEDLDS